MWRRSKRPEARRRTPAARITAALTENMPNAGDFGHEVPGAHQRPEGRYAP
ncbi:hypothetical protein ACFV2S_04135 [Streptomyces sp. NPDC059695]|uniref:hypothetical protein n=1 Tax=Streptomyces sp. NPDC059695 TaxID=3346910 RepID=UPI003699CD53